MRITISADIKVLLTTEPKEFPEFVLNLEQELNKSGYIKLTDGTSAMLRFHFHDTTVEE